MKSPIEPFRFRYFALSHHKSSMKIGTDAILLGAGSGIDDGNKWVLDIGTGCGIVALMLAQRSKAFVDAIDIDEISIVEAQENFDNSPWAGQFRAIHSSLQNFLSEENKNKYGLIVSNPPFFQNSLLSENERLNIARHNVSLTTQDFAEGVNHLLSDSGRLAVILPTDVAPGFCSALKGVGLFLITQTIIIPKTNKTAKRLILEFSRIKPGQVQIQQLSIRDANGDFTDGYKELTHMFHPDGYLLSAHKIGDCSTG